jgi:hypothetical protein
MTAAVQRRLVSRGSAVERALAVFPAAMPIPPGLVAVALLRAAALALLFTPTLRAHVWGGSGDAAARGA